MRAVGIRINVGMTGHFREAWHKGAAQKTQVHLDSKILCGLQPALPDVWALCSASGVGLGNVASPSFLIVNRTATIPTNLDTIDRLHRESFPLAKIKGRLLH